MKSIKTRRLVESAILIALGTVLSVLKIDLPMGGGVTVCCMLPLVILSFRWGWKWGLLSAFSFSLLQFALGLDNITWLAQFTRDDLGYTQATVAGYVISASLLDYVVAYTVIGFAGLFDKFVKKPRLAVAVGIAVTFFMRFLCHFITGIWVWDAISPNKNGLPSALYSLAYNGPYMAIEIVLTIIVAILIYKPLGKYFRGEDLRA